jgi:sulfur transfer protein SufE
MTLKERGDQIAAEFAQLSSWEDRYKKISLDFLKLL